MIKTRENFTLEKNDEIERQILTYLSNNYEKYEIVDEDTEEDIEFEISYYLIEKDVIKVNLNFYCYAEGSAPIWLYKKYLNIENEYLNDCIDILTSYE
tara:strand:+ start:241 stop:534 length:294 start_codon:yes stop_codon:yes gene_type:complete